MMHALRLQTSGPIPEICNYLGDIMTQTVTIAYKASRKNHIPPLSRQNTKSF